MFIMTAVMCLALNVYSEARGEPIDGQIAVAQVTMNRAEQVESEVCNTVFEKGQFSWTKDAVQYTKSGAYKIKRHSPKFTPRDKHAWEVAVAIAEAALTEGALKNVVGNATHFRNIREARRWHHGLRFVKQVGHHRFYVET
jgi:spore germination cell wall hydrolase CwlJ-like protein